MITAKQNSECFPIHGKSDTPAASRGNGHEMKHNPIEFDDEIDGIVSPQIERLMQQVERLESERPRRVLGRHAARRRIEDWQDRMSIRRSIDYLDG